MKKLKQANEEALERFKKAEELRKPHPNRIECPKCGAEMWDSSPSVILASNPPQKNVHCPRCGYKDYMIVYY